MSPTRLSSHLRWAIVLAVTALTFSYGQLARTTPSDAPIEAAAR